GGGIFNTEYLPERWANRSNYEICQTLFKQAPDIVLPHGQTNTTGTAGYNEGPYYFYYGMENMMPMMIAYNNFWPEHPVINYYRFTLFVRLISFLAAFFGGVATNNACDN